MYKLRFKTRIQMKKFRLMSCMKNCLKIIISRLEGKVKVIFSSSGRYLKKMILWSGKEDSTQ